jgi:hypothetical protein
VSILFSVHHVVLMLPAPPITLSACMLCTLQQCRWDSRQVLLVTICLLHGNDTLWDPWCMVLHLYATDHVQISRNSLGHVDGQQFLQQKVVSISHTFTTFLSPVVVSGQVPIGNIS